MSDCEDPMRRGPAGRVLSSNEKLGSNADRTFLGSFPILASNLPCPACAPACIWLYCSYRMPVSSFRSTTSRTTSSCGTESRSVPDGRLLDIPCRPVRCCSDTDHKARPEIASHPTTRGREHCSSRPLGVALVNLVDCSPSINRT